jgi:hypothetical protein
MPATRLADVIVPSIWHPYMVERTAALSAAMQSGIIAPVAEFGELAGEGGNIINMPFWQDLTGDDEVLSATGGALGVNNITSALDLAVVLARGKAWGVNELAAHLSGDDPAGAIADLVAAFWARKQQQALISVLKAIFATSGGALTATHLHNINADATAANRVISAPRSLDAIQKMGDSKSKLSGVIMHSAVQNKLAQDNLIQTIRPTDGSPGFQTFLDKRVVVDDGVPVTTGVYDTYFFGQGAFGYAEVQNSKVTPVETDRDSLAGEDILITRRHYILHPRGVAYTGAATGGGPTNAALETAGNWQRRYEPKNVRIVCLRHTIA